MKLITNELIKIIKNKFTLVLILLAILSLIVSYFVIDPKNSVDTSWTGSKDYKFQIESNINFNIQKMNSAKTEVEKEVYKEYIKLYEFIKELNPEILGIPYKYDIKEMLQDEIKTLKSIEKEEYNDKIKMQQEKVDKLWELLEKGTFEEYIDFKKAEIEKSYEIGQITEEEYKKQINKEEQNLKYEIGKYSEENSSWKEELLGKTDISEKLKYNYDFNSNIYLDDKGIENLINQKLIAEYRLENNLEPHYNNSVSNTQTGDKYLRFKYNLTSRDISMFFVGILAVYLGAICISEERSKGTIKFLLITPYKKYKILLSKMLSIIIVICTLLGGIFFKGATNEYLFVKAGQVKVMSTYIYEILTYILKIPEIILFLLIGITCSVLMKNKISNIVSVVIYIISTLGKQYLFKYAGANQWNVDFLRYIPSYNLDLIYKIFPETININSVNIIQTSMTYSIFVMIVYVGW